MYYLLLPCESIKWTEKALACVRTTASCSRNKHKKCGYLSKGACMDVTRPCLVKRAEKAFFTSASFRS